MKNFVKLKTQFSIESQFLTSPNNNPWGNNRWCETLVWVEGGGRKEGDSKETISMLLSWGLNPTLVDIIGSFAIDLNRTGFP